MARLARRGYFFIHANFFPLEGEESPLTPPATPVPTTTKKQQEHHDYEDQFHSRPPVTKPYRGVLFKDARCRFGFSGF
jgi:hypothetical protein